MIVGEYMKRVPYGESNYKKIIDKNMYFIDKTNYIETLEFLPSYQFFIRPRRFGKSLFLSMLETYYDISEKDNFEKYFKDKYIGKNKTPYANEYYILRLSFADVVTDLGKNHLIKGINTIIYNEIDYFITKYKLLGMDLKKLLNEDAAGMLNSLRSILKKSKQKLFLFIDEYDNFANGLMMKDEEMYKEIVQTDGFIKSFYKGIKEGTAEGTIERVFITGVSPVLLDDLTSGANIFENISNEYALNSMMGVTQAELEKIVDEYKIGSFVDKTEFLENMKELYNGYRFNEEVEDTIYNTGMVMYIINKMSFNKKYPKDMLDDNIKTDYGKMRILAQNFESKSELREIIEENKLVGPFNIKSRFGIDKLFRGTEKHENFISLLYYLGLMTIKGNMGRKVLLGIPNYSVKTMFWEYLYYTYSVGNYKKMQEISIAMDKMRKDADVKEIMQIYKDVRAEISNRDLTFYNEMTSKAIFITILFVDNYYILESEKENREGYADLYLKEGITYKEEIKFRYLIEFKHIKQKEFSDEKLEKKKKEAKEQLEKYKNDYKIKEDGVRPLKKLIIITIGKNDIVYEELN
jgi:hypothetical protein